MTTIAASDLAPALRAQAEADGITEVTVLGTNGLEGDQKTIAYQFGDVRVIDTNGDPVWEESDPEGFFELMDEIEAANA